MPWVRQALGEPQADEQEELVRRVGQRVDALRQYGRAAGDKAGKKLFATAIGAFAATAA